MVLFYINVVQSCTHVQLNTDNKAAIKMSRTIVRVVTYLEYRHTIVIEVINLIVIVYVISKLMLQESDIYQCYL